jgi:predicted TIM-barrel fold metal-dependent hydrolase
MVTVLKDSESARIRRSLDHPVVDGDGHWFEPMPILAEYVREIGGQKALDAYGSALSNDRWYDLEPGERQRQRVPRPGWWNRPATAIDLATSMIPALMHARLADLGVDFAFVYPTRGLVASRIPDEDLRRTVVRAVNTMATDMLRPFADRMTPVGIVTMHTPAEAIEEAEFAVRHLGMKTIFIDNHIKRTLPDGREYIDNLALDSPYDYDPVWAKLVELKVAAVTHGPSSGWPDRRSPSSYVSNHLGHFAQSHHVFARSLFLGGVTYRFPDLTFGLLEGGVGWACSLYADLISHWLKRSRPAMHKNQKPTNVDQRELRALFVEYATDERYQGKIDEILEKHVALGRPMTAEQLTERDRDSDDFGALKIDSVDDIRRLFARNFYFGCQSDDPITAWAFDRRLDTPLKPFFSSDISHFDVTDMTEVLEEAHELRDRELLDEQDFRTFTFSNVVHLHGRMNPDFFNGTAIEQEAAAELASAPSD